VYRTLHKVDYPSTKKSAKVWQQNANPEIRQRNIKKKFDEIWWWC